ncbi:hypothetical protein D3C78_859300 [compost metagenome]
MTCSMPWPCSVEAAEISPMMSLSLSTADTTRSMAASACLTCSPPPRISWCEDSISWRTSWAAPAERLARLRTSPATTAKPRPCSPARAASTEALRARMLVWKAMASIIWMIWAICSELPLMRLMLCTTAPMVVPVARTASAALPDRALACWALAAFCCTVAVICSMLAAVCCRALACCSVRADRSRLPLAIDCAAGWTSHRQWFTSVTMLPRLLRMITSISSSLPISLFDSSGGVAARLPVAICMEKPMASRSWRRKLRSTSEPTPSSKPPTSSISVSWVSSSCC